MEILQNIFVALTKYYSPKQNNLLHRFLNYIHPTSVKGLYLWGNVGVGKTCLLDIFYTCLPIPKKRFHFHAFMNQIHHDLQSMAGHRNPLDHIAPKLADETRIICFDEFYVTNVADAMLLGGLMNALLKRNVCLIATSNLSPDDLYKDGLQRERFLFTIELIKQHCHVIEVTTQHDYRLNFSKHNHFFFTPLNAHTEHQIAQCFTHFSKNEPAFSDDLLLLGRSLRVRKYTRSVLWCDFHDLCGFPRSQHDFLEIVQQYQTVIVSNMPVLSKKQTHLATNFMHLIDILYDARTHLVLSAAAPIRELYPEGSLKCAFARTESRLVEMQAGGSNLF